MLDQDETIALNNNKYDKFEELEESNDDTSRAITPIDMEKHMYI